MYNTARAQGLEKVFNVDTDPTTFTDEEKELFKAQEAIAMDILVATVPVIACQPIIRRHQDNGTAHACLVEYRSVLYYRSDGDASDRASGEEDPRHGSSQGLSAQVSCLVFELGNDDERLRGDIGRDR